MKWGIFLLGALVTLVLTGTIPIGNYSGFPTYLFESPIFAAVVALMAGSSLIAVLANKRHRRDIWLVMLHFAVILIVAGAGIRTSGRMQSHFPLYYSIKGAYIATVPVATDDKANNYVRYENLGFTLACDSFRVEHYAPDFEILAYRGQHQPPELLKTIPDDGQPFSLQPWTDSTVTAEMAAQLTETVRLTDTVYLARQLPRDKDYAARLLFGEKMNIPDTSAIQMLHPNQPAQRDGWLFYLMNYGQQNGNDYIEVLAVKDPGRYWVLTGLWLLMAGTGGGCFRSFLKVTSQLKKKGGERL